MPSHTYIQIKRWLKCYVVFLTILEQQHLKKQVKIGSLKHIVHKLRQWAEFIELSWNLLKQLE